MARTTPRVSGDILLGHLAAGTETVPISLDTPAWFSWLEQHSTFCFDYAGGTFSARKEQRFGGWYWYAYRRRGRKLHTAYLGKSDLLTSERLHRVAQLLATPAASSNGHQPRRADMSSPSAPGPRLSTKLFIPTPRPDLVHRPRLLQDLTRGVQRKLTLIAAPAGFGKTTLLSAWAARSPAPIAWVSLDASDNDATAFWDYVMAALDRLHPGVGDPARALLYAPLPQPIEAVLTMLMNGIAVLTDPVVLVLDDYHVIDAQPIHLAVTFLLEHMPPQLRVVLASRAEPPVSVARLRVQGHILEVRAADLRFTADETTSFLTEVMHLDLSPADIATLAGRTEGWIAGLHLAAVTLQGRGSPVGQVADFTGSHRSIVDYLAEEVLQRQPARVQRFLLETSILDRLNGPLCDAVTGHTGSQAMLEKTDAANLFLVPLDEQRFWYRYHHLFAEFLRNRLRQRQPDLVAQLHTRASSWHARHLLLIEAVTHALAAGEHESAANLIEQSAAMMLWVRCDVFTIQQIMKLLPDATARARPKVCLAYAWAVTLTRPSDAERFVRYAEDSLRQDQSHTHPGAGTATAQIVNRQALLGEIAAIRARVASIQGDRERTAAFAHEALANVPETDINIRALVALSLGQRA